ncbi:MAG: relaxase/mobilization nuclease domain-containing protein [Lachnospiraceae bacterium]|nr:relaxase/mobilization nuclease domain-containing protein [Lachnospiraceae bacterium]
MIVKVIENSGNESVNHEFRDIVQTSKYITNSQGIDARIAGVRISNCQSLDVDGAQIEMMLTQEMNPGKFEKTWHLFLSFHEDVQPEELKKIEDYFCKAMGLGDHQRISAYHLDTDHPHLHLCINLINPKTLKKADLKFWKRKTQKVAQEIEKIFHLQPDNHEFKRDRIAAKARDMEAQQNVQSFSSWVRENCVEDLKNAQSWQELHVAARKYGCSLIRKANGIVLEDEETGVQCKGSVADKALSYQKLVARFGYDFEREGAKARQTKKETSYQPKPLGEESEEKASLEAEYEKHASETPQNASKSHEGLFSDAEVALLLSASSWREIHEICRAKNVSLSVRGNGLSFYDHNKRRGTPAGRVHRGLTKLRLERKLGSFKSMKELVANDKAKVEEFQAIDGASEIPEKIANAQSWQEVFSILQDSQFRLTASFKDLFLQDRDAPENLYLLRALDKNLSFDALERKLGNYEQARSERAFAHDYETMKAFPVPDAVIEKIALAESWEELFASFSEGKYGLVSGIDAWWEKEDLFLEDRETGLTRRLGTIFEEFGLESLEEKFGDLQSFQNPTAQEDTNRAQLFEEFEEELRERKKKRELLRKSLEDQMKEPPIAAGSEALQYKIMRYFCDDPGIKMLWYTMKRYEHFHFTVSVPFVPKRRKRNVRLPKEPKLSWRQFVMDLAKKNDPRALKYLNDRKDAKVQQAEIIGYEKKAYEPEIQKVTLHGAKIYAHGREREDKIVFSYNATDQEIRNSLLLAKSKFGDVLTIDDKAPFELKDKIAKLARDCDVEFTNIAKYKDTIDKIEDEMLAKVRKLLKEDTKEKRQKRGKKTYQAHPRLYTLHAKQALKKYGNDLTGKDLDLNVALRLRATGHSKTEIAWILQQGGKRKPLEAVEVAAASFDPKYDDFMRGLMKSAKYLRIQETKVLPDWFKIRNRRKQIKEQETQEAQEKTTQQTRGRGR